MAEEHRCQSPPEGHRLCANNCGFFGSPATLGLCSKCYRDLCLKEEQANSAKMAVEKSLAVAKAPSLVLIKEDEPAAPEGPSGMQAVAAAVQASRCAACRKRVGLTGFRCRCGETYCGVHRYPERHGCSFDFKSAGKEAIARHNPVVKGQKLEKI